MLSVRSVSDKEVTDPRPKPGGCPGMEPVRARTPMGNSAELSLRWQVSRQSKNEMAHFGTDIESNLVPVAAPISVAVRISTRTGVEGCRDIELMDQPPTVARAFPTRL